MTLKTPHLAPKQFEVGASRSPWIEAWDRLKKNKLSIGGLSFFLFITFLSFLGPFFYSHAPQDQLTGEPLGPFASIETVEVRYDPTEAEADERITPQEFIDLYSEDPDSEMAQLQGTGVVENSTAHFTYIATFHILGADSHGRDMLARVMQGGRISLGVGFLATSVALIIGVAYGAISGYIGGKLDDAMMRIVDILYALPFIIFVILLMVVFEDSEYKVALIFITIGAVEWLTMARIVRAQVINLKKQEFVEAAKATGVKTFPIIFRHILPNVLGAVIVYATLLVPAVMLLESTLSFLGLGIKPPDASWGTLINEGQNKMQTHAWLLICPTLFFSSTLFALNFLGDGLRDALDVKTSKD